MIIWPDAAADIAEQSERLFPEESLWKTA